MLCPDGSGRGLGGERDLERCLGGTPTQEDDVSVRRDGGERRRIPWVKDQRQADRGRRDLGKRQTMAPGSDPEIVDPRESILATDCKPPRRGTLWYNELGMDARSPEVEHKGRKQARRVGEWRAGSGPGEFETQPQVADLDLAVSDAVK